MRKAVRELCWASVMCGAVLGIAPVAHAGNAVLPEGDMLSYQDYDQAIQLAQAEPESLMPKTDESENLRFDLARVNLYAETHRYGKAFDLLERLKQKYPDNARVLAAEADLNWRIGNVRGASRHLDQALLIDPSDEDILERERAIRHAQNANVSGGVLYRHTEVADEVIGAVSGELPVTDTIDIHLDVENDHLRFDRPPPPGGGDRTVNEQRGSFGATMLFGDNTVAGGTLYANTDTLGGGLQYSFWDRMGGMTLLRGDFRRPEWSYVEMVVNRGTKSAVFLQHKRPFGPELSATVGGGYNWYALDDVSDAAQSSAWTLSVEYAPEITLIDPNPDKDLRVSFAYGADGEYLTSIKRGGPFGEKVIPISDYEIHALTATARQAIWDVLAVELYGGYGINRLNQNSGPLFGGSVEYAMFDELALGVRGSHTRFGGDNNRQSENQVALNIKWTL